MKISRSFLTISRPSKKGKAGEGVKVSFSSNFTASQISQVHDFQETYGQGSRNIYFGPETGASGSWGPNVNTLAYNGATDYPYDKNGAIVSSDDPSATGPINLYDNVDNFFQTGVRWNNNLSISGGNDVATYRFSFGHTDEEGIVPKNDYRRTNLGMNINSRFFDDKLTIGGSVNFIRSAGRRIQQGSNLSGVMLGLMRTPVTFDNANGNSDPANDPTTYQFGDGTQRNYRGGGGYDNPFWIVNNNPFFDEVNRVFGTLRLSYEFTPWVTLSGTVGSDFYSDNRKQEFELGSRAFSDGQVFEDQYNYRHTDVYVNLLGNGNLTDDFTLSYNVGVNMYNESLKQNYIQGDGLNFVGFRELANTNSVTSLINNADEKTFSIFGSVDLGYKNFLYLTLTGRNDWISTLIAPSKEFNAGDIDVFYPSASLSFVFSELMNSSALSFGKLRLSVAQVGGGAPSPYATSTIFTVPNTTGTINSLNDGWTGGVLFPFEGQTGYTYNALQGNPNLIPSKTTDLEAGVDLRFLNGKLTFDGTLYKRNSRDQIIAINIPNTTGFQRAFINSGELQTLGGEIVLGVTPVRTKNFSWDLQFNFSKWKTTVESLPEGVPNQYLDGFTGSGIFNIAPDKDEDGNVTRTYEYGQILGGAFQRVNSTDDQGRPIFDPNEAYNPGGALIIDDSGSPDFASDDYNSNYGYPLVDNTQDRVLGNPNPDWLLGINSTLSYKKLRLSFLFDIKQGGDMWNGTAGALTFFGRTALTEDRVPTLGVPVIDPNTGEEGTAWVHDYSQANETFEGVKASDGSANDIAVPLDQNWYQGNGGGFGAVAENFVEDASYYRLRYITLSYNFGDMINGLSDFTLSFTGRNLLLFTPYSGFDPDGSLAGSSTNGQGLEYFQMPGIKSYAVGVNVSF